jgi:hypothetical protein
VLLRVRLTDHLRGMLTDNAPDGWLALHHASRTLGISRQTVLQKVKRGGLRAVLSRTGRRKGLRIEIPPRKTDSGECPDDRAFDVAAF